MSSLFLNPVRSDWIPDTLTRLTERLASAGLLSAEHCGRDGWCLIGENFLSLVTFMGCSPAIRLAPDPDAPGAEFCRVRVHHYPERPQFLFAQHLPVPRCPACRAPVVVSPDEMTADTSKTCSRCATISPVSGLDWKRAAGCARVFVEIAGVYPGEALPTHELLATLRECGGGDWRYFYI